VAAALRDWCGITAKLRYESIATVYVHAEHARLPLPMLALHSSTEHPAQFVFDRGQLGGPPGLLAFVVSASQDSRAALQHKVMQQAHLQLAHLLGPQPPTALHTLVEKRATFACTPGLLRPPLAIAPGLWACGDYLAGPYPATLEGAVRSGQAAAHALALSPTADRLQVPLD
jgi:predicted NAD/FAD-dependent oxidoreductase